MTFPHFSQVLRAHPWYSVLTHGSPMVLHAHPWHSVLTHGTPCSLLVLRAHLFRAHPWYFVLTQWYPVLTPGTPCSPMYSVLPEGPPPHGTLCRTPTSCHIFSKFKFKVLPTAHHSFSELQPFSSVLLPFSSFVLTVSSRI